LSENALLGGRAAWLWLAAALALGAFLLLAWLWQAGQVLTRELSVFVALMLGVVAFALVGSSPLVGSESYSFLSTWIYGMAFLAFLLWLMTFGHRRLADSYVWLALVAFALEVLYIYVRVFGSLLQTSLFFFVGGLLTMLLALFLYNLHKRLDHEPAASTNEARP
jgi:hypothetical protein